MRLATAVLAMCCVSILSYSSSWPSVALESNPEPNSPPKLAATANSQHVGGLDAEHPADEHLKGIMKQAMDKLHSSYPGGFKTMEPLSYRTQVVSGKNYFVKVSRGS